MAYIAIVFLLMGSAFFSGSEIAYTSLNKLKLKKENERLKKELEGLKLQLKERSRREKQWDNLLSYNGKAQEENLDED